MVRPRVVVALLVVLLGGCAQERTVPPNPAVQSTLVTGNKQVQPTVQAGGTQVAATMQVGGGPGPSPVPTGPPAAPGTPTLPAGAVVPTVVATATGASAQVVGVWRDPTDTRILVRNAGGGRLDMGGWEMRVGEASITLPAGVVLAPGVTVTLHTASGDRAGADVYLGPAAAALLPHLTPGARVALVDEQDRGVAEFIMP